MAFNINNNDFFSNERYGIRYRTDIQVLQYYVPAPDLWVDINGIGAQYLDDLLDVIITSPAAGQILRYNGTDWTNYTLNSVLTGGTVVDSTLRWNGVDWIESTSFLNDSSSQLVFFGISTNVNYPIAATNIFAYFKNLQSLYIGDASAAQLDIANIFSYCFSIGNDNKTTNNYQYIFGNTNECMSADSYNFLCGKDNYVSGSTSFVFGFNNFANGLSATHDLNVIFGDSCNIATGGLNFISGDTNNVTGSNNSVIFGFNNMMNVSTSDYLNIFGGQNHNMNAAGGSMYACAILAGDTNTITSNAIGTNDNNTIIGGNTNTILNSNNSSIISCENVTLTSQASVVAVSNLLVYGDTTSGEAELKMQTTTANQAAGTATLVSAGTSTVTIANTTVTADSIFLLTAQDSNSSGALRIQSRIVGTSFTVRSSIDSDNGIIGYLIINKI